MKNSCSRTILGCYVGYIVQAIVNNFVPLLFVMFERTYQIPLSKITLLITINFCIQLGIDLLSAWFLDRIGYRAAILLSHIASAAGLVLLTILPDMLPDAFTGLLIAVVIYAVGGGLLEVIVSPVMESCPTQNKDQHMSLLHSFYCWGHMGVVLLSTAFFALFGIGNWKLLALLWALVPVVNAVFFGGAPLYPMQAEGAQALSLRALVKSRVFWLFMVMMLCAGASEQAVSQWSSAFAEQGLGVSKTVGDLAGPRAFAAIGPARSPTVWQGRWRFPADFREIRRKTELKPLYGCLRGAVRRGVSVHRVRAVSGSEPAWLRRVRLLGRHFLARNVQPRIRLHPGRRNTDVRAAGAGG